MLLLYSDTITPRLSYIIDFFSRELFDEPIRITTDADEFRKYDHPRLNYSAKDFSDREFFLRPASLLFENDIRNQPIDCFELDFHKAFFATGGDFSFDIFAATFYLVSRYEEYLPHEKDEYGRYAHTNSLAYREGFLQLPLVNIWMLNFRKALLRKFPSLHFRRKNFKCLLTYDIDMAWSHKHKGFYRSVGGLARSIVSGKWKEAKLRWDGIRNKGKDPFDCYEWLDALHLYCRVKPYYFFLVAKKQLGHDKNISTDVPAFRELIEYYSKSYKTGLHPSWQSGDDAHLLKEELEWLEVVTERKIIHSRQHYIRFTLPATFRELIKAGIEKDFSMGYGSINGFRASVCSSYHWFDLEKNEQTPLLLYPFCFMDANAYYEQKFSTREAYRELVEYYEQIKKLNGVFISIWHNSILGTDPSFKGWRELFDLFMRETVYWDAYYDEA